MAATAVAEKPETKKTFLKTDQLTEPGQKWRVFHAIARHDQTVEDFLRPDFYKTTNSLIRLSVGDRIEIVAADLTWEAAVRVVGVNWTGSETEMRLIHQMKHAPATISQDANDDYQIVDLKMDGFRVKRVADGRILPGVFPSYADARAHIQKDLRIKRVG